MSESIDSNAPQASAENRRIRVFISSTFRDMMEERDALMSHAWPELRRFCLERQVELVEVDMRWGITEDQSTRKETLKLCLDEIRSCRPYFIGLIGERYGWIPGNEAFTADLKEEQPWIVELNGKSVTELEILHGVLNNPEMAGRSFFYFRDPEYSKGRGPDFQAEDTVTTGKLDKLKERIRKSHKAGQIQLYENYPDPTALSTMILEHLKSAIDTQFPREDIPDSLTREANSHESFAEVRRRTYVGRDDYFKTLDRHVDSDGGPLVLLGDSGSGKTALLANWVAHWKKEHPGDFIFQHYIGGTPDSADHWKMIRRLMAEIKKWSDDPDELPMSHDDIARDFPLWLSKARLKAQRDSVRCILVLDALNQLEDQDNSRQIGWLPPHVFSGPLRLIVSTLPGETMDAVSKYGWETLRIEKLTEDERRRMIVDYLGRFGKKLDAARIDRIIAFSATENPLYLKILLDELRITGTHDKLDERLNTYLSEPDIPRLLKNVLTRYQRHYERDREGLVKEALGLIFSARRGLSETELLQLLRPVDLEQLPQAVWTPLRAAMEELLIDRGGILNFGHDFLHTAVKEAFVPGTTDLDRFRLQLADYFEALPASARSCDELPWLLRQTKSKNRLRTCLLDVNCFLRIYKRDEVELQGYWVGLGEQRIMGKAYLQSFDQWSKSQDSIGTDIGHAANQIACFLNNAALYVEAEPLYRSFLMLKEKSSGKDHPIIATGLNNLAGLLHLTNRTEEAEPLYCRALSIYEKNYGKEHPNVAAALNNLAQLLHLTNRMEEAKPLMLRALSIDVKNFGEEHPVVAKVLGDLAKLLRTTNQMKEAEPLMRRALRIYEKSFGKDHPDVAIGLNNLAQLLKATNRMKEAEPLMRRALSIYEKNYGKEHPNVAAALSNLAQLFHFTNRMKEAEPLMRRALSIDEKILGAEHPNVASYLTNLARLLHSTNRIKEAEPLYRRALNIKEKSFGKEHYEVAIILGNLGKLLQDTTQFEEAELLHRRALNIKEKSFGHDHPDVATGLINLAQVLQDTNRLGEAEPLMRRSLSINEKSFGKAHPSVATDLHNLAGLLHFMNHMEEAESLMRRALSIDEKNLGLDHPRVAIGLNNLAQLLKDTNRTAEVETLMHRVLSIDEKSLGLDHPRVATGLSNLAELLRVTNRVEEAEPLMLRALSISEASFGKDHPRVGRCLNNLAQLLKDTNRMEEAEALMRRVLSIYEKSFGKNHPRVAIGLSNLALLLEDTNRIDEAEPLMRRALNIDEKTFGKDHPNIVTGLNNLAGLLHATNRLEEAEVLYRRLLHIKEKIYDSDAWQVASALINLSVVYRKIGRFNDAEPSNERALTVYEKSLGHGHHNTLNAGTNLAYLKFLMNKPDEAATLCSKYLDAHRENQEKSGSIQTTQLRKLANCYHDLAFHSDVPAEQWKEAEGHCRLSLEYYKRLEDSEGFAKAEQLLNQVLKKKQSSN